MCVNNLPRVALDIGVAGDRTHEHLIASLAPYHYATESLLVGHHKMHPKAKTKSPMASRLIHSIQRKGAGAYLPFRWP